MIMLTFQPLRVIYVSKVLLTSFINLSFKLQSTNQLCSKYLSALLSRQTQTEDKYELLH